MDNSKLLLTTAEAAEILGIGRSVLYELMARGEITGIKIGRSRRIPRAEVEGYVRRLCEEQSAEATAEER